MLSAGRAWGVLGGAAWRPAEMCSGGVGGPARGRRLQTASIPRRGRGAAGAGSRDVSPGGTLQRRDCRGARSVDRPSESDFDAATAADAGQRHPSDGPARWAGRGRAGRSALAAAPAGGAHADAGPSGAAVSLECAVPQLPEWLFRLERWKSPRAHSGWRERGRSESCGPLPRLPVTRGPALLRAAGRFPRGRRTRAPRPCAG